MSKPIYYKADPSNPNGAWPNGSNAGWLDGAPDPPTKNGTYHVRDMLMLYRLAELLGGDFPLAEFKTDNVTWHNLTPLQHLYQVYMDRRHAWGETLDASALSWFESNQ